MGILNRLGNVLKSYAHSDNYRSKASSSIDPDLNAAYEDLENFLRGGNPEGNTGKPKKEPAPFSSQAVQDFAELGLSPGASLEECKEAYKNLLKIHHPDRHAKHEGNMRKATNKTARVNAAYERLVEWHREKKENLS